MDIEVADEVDSALRFHFSYLFISQARLLQATLHLCIPNTLVCTYHPQQDWRPAHLDIPVQVPELLHVGKGFDTSPAVVGEEVYRTHNIGDGREPQ